MQEDRDVGLALLHLQLQSERYEVLYDARSGSCIEVSQQGIVRHGIAFGFRTGLALGCADLRAMTGGAGSQRI